MKNSVSLLFFVILCVISFSVRADSNTEENLREKQNKQYAEREKLQNEANAVFSTDYINTLSSGKKKLEDWADELEKTDPTTPTDIWTTYHVCLRAGRYETAEKMLPKLYAVIEPVEAWHFKVREVFTPLRPSTDDYPLSPEMFRLQVRFYEVFGRIHGKMNFGHAFRSTCPWTPKEMLDWVKARYFEAVEYDVKLPVNTSLILSPMGSSLRDIPSKAARDWQSHYFTQLQLVAHKREIEPEQYLDSIRNECRRLAEGAKTDPGNLKKLLYFINATERCGFMPDSDENTPDLKWLAENAENRSGLEAMSLAEQFVRLGESRKRWHPGNRRTAQKEIDPAVETEIKLCNAAAEPFWRRALADPPPRWVFDIPDKIYHLSFGTTKEEEREMIERMYRQAQEAHASKLRQGLAKTLTALGRDEEARGILDEDRQRNPERENLTPIVFSPRSTIERKTESPTPPRRAIAKPPTDTRASMEEIQKLLREKKFEQAIPVIEKAIAEAERIDKGRLHYYKMSMIRATTETGDWRRLEKFTEEVFQSDTQFLDGYLNRLRKAAELAEKDGATEDAERIRKRIAKFDTRK